MAVTDYLNTDAGSDLRAVDLLVSPYGYAVVSVLSAVTMLAARYAVSPLIDDAVHPVTVWAFVAGLLGGAIMSYTIGVGITVTRSELPRLRALQWSHVMYGTVGGAIYPWVYTILMAAPPASIADFPATLHTGQAWGMLMFVAAAVTYYAAGAIGGVGNNIRQWGAIVGMYLVYGVFLGVWMGFWTPLFG
jgi:hypothetical protein